MNSVLFYKVMSGFYDLLDVIYFRKYETGPRKVVNDSIKSGDRILDLCTGTGTNAVNIAKRDNSVLVEGVDISEDMLHIAKSKAQKANLANTTFHLMDATNMNYEDGCFDKILLSLVLHETEEELAGRMITEAIRVLKDDGEIIITEWERSTKLLRKLLFLPIEILEPKPYKTFVVKDLHKYFAGFGLEVIEEKHCDYSKVLRFRKNG